MTYKFTKWTSLMAVLLCLVMVVSPLGMLALADEEDDIWFDEEPTQALSAADIVYFQPERIVQIEGGSTFTLVLYDNGSVWAWGANNRGQLGNGTNEASIIPVQVKGLPTITKIAAYSNHSLALATDGTVWAWGFNNVGQLGTGAITESNIPLRVEGIDNVIDFNPAPGVGNFCIVLKADGTVWGWGDNSNGQLGDGTTLQRRSPVQAQIEDVIALSSGGFHTVALLADGNVWSWGGNSTGELGNNSSNDSSIPVKTLNLENITKIVSGGGNAFAFQPDSALWAWGFNNYGQLGDGGTVNRITPGIINISNISSDEIVELKPSVTASCILKTDGTLWSWGTNTNGILGTGGNHQLPQQITTQDVVEYFSYSVHQGYAILADKTAWAWGSNYNGLLGDYTTTRRNTPVQMFPDGQPIPIDLPPTRIWLEIEVGATEDLRATALPGEFEVIPANWSSADSGIASVNGNGVVTGVSAGMSIVTVKTMDGVHSANIGILVVDGNEDIEELRLEVKLMPSAACKLTATDSNDEVTADVIWTAANPAIVSVDADGRVTALGTGVTPVSATTQDGQFVDLVYVRVL